MQDKIRRVVQGKKYLSNTTMNTQHGDQNSITQKHYSYDKITIWNMYLSDVSYDDASPGANYHLTLAGWM